MKKLTFFLLGIIFYTIPMELNPTERANKVCTVKQKNLQEKRINA